MKRNGVTLTEILITLLIMAIGVVTVATLFPISLMRSVRATNLTHATILRHNVETSLGSDPSILFDPDSDWNPAVDDNGLHEHVLAPNLTFAGTSESVYLVDPLGFAVTGQPRFGSVPRFGLGVPSEAVARKVACLETWSTIGEDVPETVNLGTQAAPATPQSVTFRPENTVDLPTAQSTAAAGLDVRAAIFNSTGRVSEVRPISATDINGIQLQWAPPLGNPQFYSGGISTVALEARSYDYSWLLTVRNQSDTTNAARQNWTLKAEVDAAIFFRRGFAPGDEQVFTPVFPGNRYTIEGAGKQYTVRWPGADKPAVKKGGYVLDVEHGRWFRIEAVSETANSATFVVDESPGAAIQEAAFMRGIVEVFRIGQHSLKLR